MNATIPTERRRSSPWLAAIAAAAVTWGCTPTADTRGNLPLPEVVERIEAGKQNRDQIATMLGTPSTMASFSKRETWYYIGERTETFAFFKPKLIERRILVISFDAAGKVAKIATYDASDGKAVELVERVTPTKGKKLGILEQVIGNVGRFSSAPE